MSQDPTQDQLPYALPSPPSPAYAPSSRSAGIWRYLVLPIVLLVAMVGLTLAVWQRELWEERSRINQQGFLLQYILGQRLEKVIAQRFAPLQYLRNEVQLGDIRIAAQFERIASLMRQEAPELLLLAWVDETGQCKAANPSSEFAALSASPIAGQREWAGVLSEVQEPRGFAIGEVTQLSSAESTLPIALAIRSDQASAGAGAIVAQLDVDWIFERIVDGAIRDQFDVQLEDAKRTIYQTTSRSWEGAKWERLTVMGRKWRLRVLPKPQFVQAAMGRSPQWILWGGLVGSVLIAGALFEALYHRWEDNLRREQYLAALESLNEVGVTISGRVGSGRDVLDQLAESARQLLQMDVAAISLVNRSLRRAELIAISGKVPQSMPVSYDLTELPATRRCVDDGDLVFVEDVGRSRTAIGAEAVKKFDVGSFILIPLRVENEQIGVLTLGAARTRTFSTAERRLAELLGSQVAVTLTNSRMYDMMSAALHTQTRLLEQRERLYAVNSAIYHAGTLHETLQKIAELAPGALSVDACSVWLLDGKDTLRLAAMTAPFGQTMLGRVVDLSNDPAREIFQTRQPRVIRDAMQNPVGNPAWRAFPEFRSGMYIPLFRESDEPLGAMVLARKRVQEFTDEQLNLSRVFSVRAAAAIENARLHEQARHDAEVRAVLLRELNHRVKNNLAGIIALLSMGQAELPEAAQQWLQRVIERIGTMARAQQMFLGGMESVGLTELVEQMLPALSVVRTPATNVQLDLNGAQVKLQATQAVSLAMALHELCYNAIVHGMQDAAGTLIIRARCPSADTVVIDVIDDGCGANLQKIEARSALTASDDGVRRRGLGLELVKGLVSRELHGQFTLQPGETRGTVATIEFPVKSHNGQEML